jgi:hypothetical protein
MKMMTQKAGATKAPPPTSVRRKQRQRSAQKTLRTRATTPTKESGGKGKEVNIKIFRALRPLDGFEFVHKLLRNGKLYPKTFLHHATVLEILSDREDDNTNSLQYLVDFAPKNSLQIETAFKLLVLRTQVPGVIRHEIVHKTFTRKYASSGLEFIGEVKRKSILEAVLFALSSSSSDDEEDKNSKMNTILYEAVDRVSAKEFYASDDWRNLALCENDCRDFAKAYLKYLLNDSDYEGNEESAVRTTTESR